MGCQEPNPTPMFHLPGASEYLLPQVTPRDLNSGEWRGPNPRWADSTRFQLKYVIQLFKIIANNSTRLAMWQALF